MAKAPSKAANMVARRHIGRALERFGRDVRLRREKLNLTQAAAAKLAGISQSHWSKIERGKHDLSVGHALRVQFALQAESLEGMLGQQPSSLVLIGQSGQRTPEHKKRPARAGTPPGAARS